MSSLESVDCILQFFGESPQFVVVEEYTWNMWIESSDFYCKNEGRSGNRKPNFLLGLMNMDKKCRKLIFSGYISVLPLIYLMSPQKSPLRVLHNLHIN